MDETVYPFHQGARTALIVVGVLLIFLIVTIPFAIYVFIRVRGGKVVVTKQGLTATALGSERWSFDDVARLGVLKVPIVARGVGGALARAKVGGDHGVNLVIRTKAGKDKKFIVSQYANWQEIIERVKQSVPVPCEEIQMGMFSWKWPEKTS